MLEKTIEFADLFEKETGRCQILLPLNVQGLTFKAGGRTLIDGIDLKLTHGAITMVMGANGAGKSLLLRLLHGLIAPAAGHICWGENLSGDTARARQAMMFQKPVLLRRSVAANIDFVLELQNEDDISARRQELLQQVGLEAQAHQPARLLSGGEQQRLALARVLATKPDVLFLDEPTANLDPASVLMIEQIVKQLHETGTKIIFVTHDIGQARRLAHEIIFLHSGKIVEHTPAELFFQNPASAQARDYLSGRLVL